MGIKTRNAIVPPEARCVGNENYYEALVAGKTSLSNPGAFAVNKLGTGMHPDYFGSREFATQNTVIPPLAQSCVIEIEDVVVKHLIECESFAGLSDSQLRDVGRTIRNGDIIIINTRKEMEDFIFISKSLNPITPLTAKVSVTYYNIPIPWSK